MTRSLEAELRVRCVPDVAPNYDPSASLRTSAGHREVLTDSEHKIVCHIKSTRLASSAQARWGGIAALIAGTGIPVGLLDVSLACAKALA